MVGALWVLTIAVGQRCCECRLSAGPGFPGGCTEQLTVTRRGRQCQRSDSGGRAARRAQAGDHSKAWIWVTFCLGSLQLLLYNLETVSTGTVLMLIKRKDLFNKKREKPFESPTISVVWDIISSEANK